MNKNLTFLSVVLIVGILLTACGASVSGQMPAKSQSNGVQQISAHLQATDEPVVPLPTIQVVPANSNGSAQMPYNTILVYVLVGAVILIALVAVLRKS
jgi:hypothetical protein